jgi:hypothetical protein
MAYTESSFGARLGKAQELLVFIQGFENYNPTRLEETVEGFGILVSDFSNLNNQVAGSLEEYREITKERQIQFKDSPISMIKTLPQVRGAVESQFGKQSVQARDLSALIRKIRGVKITKAPKSLETDQQIATQSISQKSYGALTQLFSDFVTSVEKFQGYQISNPNLTIQGLWDKATVLKEVNIAVANRVQQLSNTRSQRIANHDDLKDRVQRIKGYVKAQYGLNSQEYSLIKGIRV